MPTEKEIEDVRELMKKGKKFAEQHGTNENLEEILKGLEESAEGFNKASDKYLKSVKGE
jgi:hypothetical protein